MTFPLILADSSLIDAYFESDVPSTFASTSSPGSFTDVESSPAMTSLELRPTTISSSSTFSSCTVSELSISPDI